MLVNVCSTFPVHLCASACVRVLCIVFTHTVLMYKHVHVCESAFDDILLCVHSHALTVYGLWYHERAQICTCVWTSMRTCMSVYVLCVYT